MDRKEQSSAGAAAGLRTRYFPKNRVGQGLIGMAPWVDVVLLVVTFLIVNSELMVQPGVIVDLPQAPFREGSSYGLMAVVMSVKGTEGRPREDIVFFDDERFLLRNEDQTQNLKQMLAARIKEHPDAHLIVAADRNVSHGTVMAIMNMALDVGVKRVNVAETPL